VQNESGGANGTHGAPRTTAVQNEPGGATGTHGAPRTTAVQNEPGGATGTHGAPRNPQTGEAIVLTARRVLVFKASDLFRLALNTRRDGTVATAE
jgi:hypothetical protein